MPQRFLRPGITNSSRWNAVSFAAESAYTRILTRVDDFGQFDGRPAVILGECWSVWNAINPTKPMTLASLSEHLTELVTVGLLEFWDGDHGKIYLQITQWQERVRDGCKPRWRDEGVKYQKLNEITPATGSGKTVFTVKPAQPRPHVNGTTAQTPGLIQKDIGALENRIKEIKVSNGMTHGDGGWHGELCPADKVVVENLRKKQKALQRKMEE
jgi:hypothetical protein